MYGLGEIILVVIGILIALQVNNWSEKRAYDQVSMRLLHDIFIDIEYSTFERSLNYYESQLTTVKDFFDNSSSMDGRDLQSLLQIPIVHSRIIRVTDKHNILNNHLEGISDYYRAQLLINGVYHYRTNLVEKTKNSVNELVDEFKYYLQFEKKVIIPSYYNIKTSTLEVESIINDPVFLTFINEYCDLVIDLAAHIRVYQQTSLEALRVLMDDYLYDYNPFYERSSMEKSWFGNYVTYSKEHLNDYVGVYELSSEASENFPLDSLIIRQHSSGELYLWNDTDTIGVKLPWNRADLNVRYDSTFTFDGNWFLQFEDTETVFIKPYHPIISAHKLIYRKSE